MKFAGRNFKRHWRSSANKTQNLNVVCTILVTKTNFITLRSVRRIAFLCFRKIFFQQARHSNNNHFLWIDKQKKKLWCFTLWLSPDIWWQGERRWRWCEMGHEAEAEKKSRTRRRWRENINNELLSASEMLESFALWNGCHLGCWRWQKPMKLTAEADSDCGTNYIINTLETSCAFRFEAAKTLEISNKTFASFCPSPIYNIFGAFHI